ncbi:MAG: hypothetical protein ACJ735_00295 [Actinomycetes bacterium]
MAARVRRVFRRGLDGTETSLAIVAVAYALLQVALGPARIGLGWDEAVYVSQVAPNIPTAYFSAPRSRGVSLLVAPIAQFTTSTAAIRAYLIVLSALGVYGAFRIWLRVLSRPAVVLAAVLFAGLWPTIFYGNEAMPNFWVAILAVGSLGCLVAAVQARENRRRLYVVAGLCIAAMGLIRPSDAGWFALPIVVAALTAWRRTWVLQVTVLGLVAGIAPWVIEAYTSYGGLGNRLHLASLNEGGLRPHVGFVYEARALYGPLLCRPCARASHPLALDIWWVLLPVAVVAAVALARRTSRFSPLLFAGLCSVSVAAPYLFLVGYAAPRFLLPAYALAALPVADLLTTFVGSAVQHRIRFIAVVSAVAIFLSGQVAVAAFQVPVQQVERVNYSSVASQLHGLGIKPPCMLDGNYAAPVAYYARCDTLVAHGSPRPRTESDWVAYADQHNLTVITRDGELVRPYARHWRIYTFRNTDKHRWVAYLPPPR